MKQNIVLGNRAYCSVYYEDGGIFLNSQIAVSGMLLAENLEDFEFIHIEEEETQDCFALEVFGDHAVRIAKPLGTVKPLKAIKQPEVKIPAATIIIDDSCGLSADAVVHALNELADDHTRIIYLMLSNVDETLFVHLAEEYLDQLTVVTSADILRQGGMDIRCGLSWESTAKDLLWEVLAHKHFVKLIKKCDLVVRLGLEGAVWFSPERKNSLTLVFRPDCIENDICRNTRGMMPGLDEMFAKELSASITAESIIKAVAAVFSYYINGYTIEEQAVSYNDSVIIPPLSVVDIPFDRLSNQTEGWSLAACQAEIKMESIAEDIVFKGLGALKEVPSVTFGALTTIDRSEIERFRIIRNLFEEYLKNPKPARPLCIAVFGTPGSGKSFGVAQVAKAVGKGQIEKITFNISQMRDDRELKEAFHQVQDACLKGSIPLVFFDEFDSDKNAVPLGWIKEFLAPMQDGEFTDNGVHPIGKCIFVFAGGVFENFDEFAEEQANKSAKVRDFISRLRGYINIQGPNPVSEQDKNFILRRAVLLRSLIERKIGGIISAGGQANVDRDIVRAMLRLPKFRHGVRSMEAIIDMSMLAGKRRWNKSDLPDKNQLVIHVEGENFKQLLQTRKYMTVYREEIAQAIHGLYLDTIKDLPAGDQAKNPNNCAWEALSEEFKESNRAHADDILNKIEMINCALQPKSIETEAFTLTDGEIEILAIEEHKRWMSNAVRNGWKYGPVKDPKKKVNPYLVPWEELEKGIKELDRNPVRNIPKILEIAGLSIYRVL